MVEIEDRLHDLKQGERSVADYVAELKGLWADADYLKPIELPHSECVAWVKKWIEEKRVIQFLRGLNPEFVVPPKVFGCTCFVRDHRPSVGKLDPRAIKCIFVGYSLGQKGYKCWSPSERCLFVSMDVTFRESVPFYGEKTDLNFLSKFDSVESDEVNRQGRKMM